MPAPRHKAIIAGLAVTLTLGGVALPAVATTSETSVTDSDPNGVGMPAPASFDKADYYEGSEGVSTFASARSASSLSPVALSDEMKYFTKFESGCDYDKGLSYGDGYNAMGYYQFDRRYSLLPFIQQAYSYNPTKYSMFEAVLAQRDLLSSPSYGMYDDVTRQLTAPAQLLNDAWHAAYAADPSEFSALQDAYAYNNYYLPVQSSLLNTYGVDVRNRADCVKGLVWGMCNLFGQGGVQKILQGANINNQMTDRELVEALCDTVVDKVDDWYPNQSQYWNGWKNRYRKEKAACLAYLDQYEADQGAGDQGASSGDSNGAVDGGVDGGDSGQNAPDTGNPGPVSDGASSDPGSAGADSDSSGVDSDGIGSGANDAVPGDFSSDESDEGDLSTDGATSSSDAGSSGSSGMTGSNVDATTGESPNEVTSPADGSSSAQPSGGAGYVESEGGKDETGAVLDNKVPTSEIAGNKNSVNSLGVSNLTSGSSSDREEEGDASSRKANATEGGLPQTGDIAAMVMTGAAGLAVAGGSFLSLAKKERDDR